MSVLGFGDILQGPFADYLRISQVVGGDVAEHSLLVKAAFEEQLKYIQLAAESAQPSQGDVANLLRPTSDKIGAIQNYREKHRTSPFFNHLSAISESIPALGWVTVTPAPSPYVKEMNDAGQFYTNRVLKDWKEKDRTHVDWVKSWIQTLTELQAFVKQHHTTGLVWAGKGAPRAGGPPPPPPGCPPPPPVLDFEATAAGDAGLDRSALFAEINRGQDVTRGLKKVTSEMQTHKNPTLRQGPAPFKPAQGQGSYKPLGVDKPPSFQRDGKKWMIEYQKGNNNLLVENAEMNNVVYLFKCENSTIQVRGKINSITIDSCKKTSIVFDSLVSSMEFINCQSVQMQVVNTQIYCQRVEVPHNEAFYFLGGLVGNKVTKNRYFASYLNSTVMGKVPTISIDKTDGCQIYLSPDSLDVEIISSKSSEMNVLVPKGDGDYTELAVPEQYRTRVTPQKTLFTEIVENKG